jgi:hypothetical protein
VKLGDAFYSTPSVAGGKVYASPVVANGTLYVATNTGWLWAVGKRH